MNVRALALVPSIALAAAPGSPVLVFCSPGSPGTSAEAQPTMDLFAAAVAAKAAIPALRAVYEEAEDQGVTRLRANDAVLGVVSLPFFLKHEHDLGLKPRLQPIPAGRDAMERWALVAKKGAIGAPAALDGFTIVSTAGFAPAFVRGPAVTGWGPIPASVRIVQSNAVLSALRRAAAGEKTAVLLDGAQAAALQSLSFAAGLEVVTRSPPLPAGVVASVGARVPAPTISAITAALQALPSDKSGAAALDAIQTARFATIDEQALTAARKAYADVGR